MKPSRGWEAKSRLGSRSYGVAAGKPFLRGSRLGSRSYGGTDGKPSHGWEAVSYGGTDGKPSHGWEAIPTGHGWEAVPTSLFFKVAYS